MTNKDREQYIDVLLALAGHGNLNTPIETHEEKEEEVVCKNGLRFRKALKKLTFGCM